MHNTTRAAPNPACLLDAAQVLVVQSSRTSLSVLSPDTLEPLDGQYDGVPVPAADVLSAEGAKLDPEQVLRGPIFSNGVLGLQLLAPAPASPSRTPREGGEAEGQGDEEDEEKRGDEEDPARVDRPLEEVVVRSFSVRAAGSLGAPANQGD